MKKITVLTENIVFALNVSTNKIINYP